MNATAAPTVFLSYASSDREAARVLRDALPNFGLEVWYDESELGGGDVWDQKIRKQIRECDYFMPIISAQTEARHEGYFRREWRLAVERTLDMADDHAFRPRASPDRPQSVRRQRSTRRFRLRMPSRKRSTGFTWSVGRFGQPGSSSNNCPAGSGS
jgi:hypothetical protein